MPTTVQECVTMSLKFCQGKAFLYLIDHAARLSTPALVTPKKMSKNANTIF